LLPRQASLKDAVPVRMQRPKLPSERFVCIDVLKKPAELMHTASTVHAE